MPVKSGEVLGHGSRAIRAISHPMRNAIQCILYNRMASPKEMGEELDEDVSNISYHVKKLEKNRTVEPVKEEGRRGAVEHFYRAVIPPFHDDAKWAALPKSTSRREPSGVPLTALNWKSIIWLL